ncbi:MAG: hydrogenase nickel incorporation protein HypB [bacterium]|nr:hydrogenase nickel incorporation protein HypB [bacterium]
MCSVCGCGHADERHEVHAHHHHKVDPALIEIEQSILSANDSHARDNRDRLTGCGHVALNLMSSPGAGKTTLLVETIRQLGHERAIGVIEGDQATSRDAERIRAGGVNAVQINTGQGCHLDAHMVGHALDDLDLPRGAVVFIENVGNLVCPAAFDLGETARVVILSVTEGDDKPLKYPDMFAGADLMIVSKTDLLPHVDFDIKRVVERARRLNPDLPYLALSARDGTGMASWIEWIMRCHGAVPSRAGATKASVAAYA